MPPPSIVPRVLLGCHDIEWGVSGSLFTSLRFHGGTKGFALCGVLLPSTPLWSVLTLLCAATLRYSSLMFQVPLWTSTKAREYPLWSLRALSPPVRCCLPASCLLPLCGCPCVCVLFCPSLCCPLSLCSGCPWSEVLSLLFGSSLSFCRCYSIIVVLGGFSSSPLCLVPFWFLCFCSGFGLLVVCGWAPCLGCCGGVCSRK